MLEEGYRYWFTDHDHLRSPFPASIHDELRTKTSKRFEEWVQTVGEEDLGKLEEAELVEMFEMFLFNVALSLCHDPDQQITISYPFMPRCGDEVNDVNNGLSQVAERKVIDVEENKRQLKLFMKTKPGDIAWQTAFDLPA